MNELTIANVFIAICIIMFVGSIFLHIFGRSGPSTRGALFLGSLAICGVLGTLFALVADDKNLPLWFEGPVYGAIIFALTAWIPLGIGMSTPIY